MVYILYHWIINSPLITNHGENAGDGAFGPKTVIRRTEPSQCPREKHEMSAGATEAPDARPRRTMLVVRAGSRSYAVPVEVVLETMRPLPIETIVGTPIFVRGLSVIRGAPVPVIDLAMLLESREAATKHERFVTVRSQGGTFALEVDGVVGVRDLDWNQLEELPPVLGRGADDPVEAIAVVDKEFLMVLRSARIVPDEIWKNVDAQKEVR